MNISEKILARHAGRDKVVPGEIVTCKLDMVLANDVTAPPSIKEFEKIGKPVFDNEKIALIPDHFQPAKDIKSADLAKAVRDFSKKHNLKYYFEAGRVGIEHVILPEMGIVGPGMLTIGADSHTCTYGAVNGFSTGVGTTDLAVAMATGEAWFKVPETIEVRLKGEKAPHITGKDVILYLIGEIGVDGALYQALEFTGDVKSLTMTDRLTISNMAIEAGAKNGVFPFDEITKEYVEGRVQVPYEPVNPDADAKYIRTVEIDLSKLRPVVAFPHLPENTKAVADIKDDIKIQQVVIGSCTNGRLEDLQIAAEVLKGKKIHDNVRCIVIPGSQWAYKEAMRLGYVDAFIDAGCVVSCPTCGPCLGGYMGILSAGERCVSTTNRNFRGRMGHVDSEVYLASPYTAACSAIMGKIAEEVR